MCRFYYNFITITGIYQHSSGLPSEDPRTAIFIDTTKASEELLRSEYIINQKLDPTIPTTSYHFGQLQNSASSIKQHSTGWQKAVEIPHYGSSGNIHHLSSKELQATLIAPSQDIIGLPYSRTTNASMTSTNLDLTQPYTLAENVSKFQENKFRLQPNEMRPSTSLQASNGQILAKHISESNNNVLSDSTNLAHTATAATLDFRPSLMNNEYANAMSSYSASGNQEIQNSKASVSIGDVQGNVLPKQLEPLNADNTSNINEQHYYQSMPNFSFRDRTNKNLGDIVTVAASKTSDPSLNLENSMKAIEENDSNTIETCTNATDVTLNSTDMLKLSSDVSLDTLSAKTSALTQSDSGITRNPINGHAPADDQSTASKTELSKTNESNNIVNRKDSIPTSKVPHVAEVSNFNQKAREDKPAQKDEKPANEPEVYTLKEDSDDDMYNQDIGKSIILIKNETMYASIINFVR